MREYQSNSHKSRELGPEVSNEKTSDRRAKKVVTGTVKTKKNDGRKILSMFITEDIHSVKSYVVQEVIIPMLKNGIVEIGNTFLEKMFYGSERSDRRRTGLNDRVSYRKYYDDRNNIRYESAPAPSRFEYKDIILGNRADAESVLLELRGMLREYGVVKVGDLYDAIGEVAPHTAFNYGWTDLSRATIKPVRDGYMLILPKAMAID